MVVAGVLLGLGFYAIELRDALAEQEAFQRATAFVRQHDPQASIRCYGTWGFVHHTEQAGFGWAKNAGEDLRPGDWFIHDPRDGKPLHPSVAPHLVLMQRIIVKDRLPLNTQGTFYASRTPILHHEGPRVEIVVYRYPR